MAEPNVRLFMESAGGSQSYAENSSNYTEIDFGVSQINYTGDGTTTASLDPVTLPAENTKLAEECWVRLTADTPAVYTQVKNYGVHTKQYEFVVLFEDEDCAARPRLEAWDSLAELQTLTAPENEILIGTAGTTSKSFLRAYDASGGAPGENWYDSSTQAADGNNNKCLQGNQSYLEAQADKLADSYWYFKLACVVPYDAGIGIASHDHVLVIRYFYV